MVMVNPPLSPSVKSMDAIPLPGVAKVNTGAEGVAAGVTLTDVDEAPLPAALTALR